MKNLIEVLVKALVDEQRSLNEELSEEAEPEEEADTVPF